MNKKGNQVYLIAERDCGGCEACCVSLTIDIDELKKLPNTPCQNLRSEGGCKIYDNWPDLCDKYYCAWRFLPELSDEWRPDQCGILLEFSSENFPGPFAGRVGLKFTIIDQEKALNFEGFYRFLIKQTNNGTPCILSYGTNPGELPVPAFLNFALHQAVKSGQPQKVRKEIEKAIEACKKQPVEKLTIHKGKVIPAAPA